MLKKSILSIVIIAFLGALSVVGINKYIDSITSFEYGSLPEEQIPETYKNVTYTIPTVDEQGHANAQTFTMENGDKTNTTVKLKVRNDKVKAYEMIDKKDVPQNVKKKMPQTIY
ncbi:MAG TPA: YxeA family protein [Pseudogracilibacillus sp.]|nr:YxeA family protein [Pseudogracilibacillus sp.]